MKKQLYSILMGISPERSVSKKKCFGVSIGAALFACSLQPALGYDVATHAFITNAAFAKSKLASPTQLQELGIDRYTNNVEGSTQGAPFGRWYFDVQGANVVLRPVDSVAAERYEREVMLDAHLAEEDRFKLSGWLVRGAIREDDNSSEMEVHGYDDDPYNPGMERVFNHFYDPVHHIGLLTLAGERALDWATGTDDALVDPNTRGSNTKNHFTTLDAREAMFRALTGLSRDGSPVTVLGGPATEDDRRTYWATVFRALGAVLHLNQDMAQPQHSRNEPHSGVGPGPLEDLITGHASVYEYYIGARVKGATAFSNENAQDGTVTIGVKPLVLSEYPQIPRFSKYTDFWAGPNGSGLAQYSNSGFFTEAHNFGEGTFALPASDPTAYQFAHVTPTRWDGTPLTGQVIVLQGDVQDALLGEAQPLVPLTTFGIWDQFLEQAGKRHRFTLNHVNYDAMADLLIPRAVAYSTGLIDYFFRGKMEISLPDEGVYSVVDHSVESQPGSSGFRKVKLKIQNITPSGTGIEPMRAGSLWAIAKFHRNTCYGTSESHDLSREYGSSGTNWTACRSPQEEIVVSAAVPAPEGINTAPQSVAFLFDSPIPINATDLYLQVVYRGPLGEEGDAVVVTTKDISEPTFDLGYYNTLEQNLYGYAGSLRTFKETYCDSVTPPVEYEQCKYDHRYSGYARFTPPVNYDPNNPIATFGAVVTFNDVPVSRYGRAGILTNPGTFTLYKMQSSARSSSVFDVGEATLYAAKNQLDVTTGGLEPTPYYRARGIYGTAEVYQQLSAGDAPKELVPDMNPLTPVPAAINF
jgi:hypothetical protein